MTKQNLKLINEAHDRLEQLEHEGRFVDADRFYETNLWAFDYDRKGNWIGSVPHENGWTP